MIKDNEAQLSSLYNRTSQLQEKIQSLQSSNQTEKAATIEQFKQTFKSMTADYDKKYDYLCEKLKEAEANIVTDQSKFGEVFQQEKEEYREFTQKTNQLLEREMEEEKKKMEEMRTQNSKKSKEIERFNLRKIELESLIKETQSQLIHLEEEYQTYQKKHNQMID